MLMLSNKWKLLIVAIIAFALASCSVDTKENHCTKKVIDIDSRVETKRIQTTNNNVKRNAVKGAVVGTGVALLTGADVVTTAMGGAVIGAVNSGGAETRIEERRIKIYTIKFSNGQSIESDIYVLDIGEEVSCNRYRNDILKFNRP